MKASLMPPSIFTLYECRRRALRPFLSRSVSGVLAFVFLLLSACRSKDYGSTAGLLASLRLGYDSYLLEGGMPVEGKVDVRQFKEMLMGKNAAGVAFIELRPSSLDTDGYVIDEWKMRLRIEPVLDLPGQIEIRSAGADKAFGTPDDVLVVSSKRGG